MISPGAELEAAEASNVSFSLANFCLYIFMCKQ